jgi:AraC-like DNA-binding protein
MDYLRSNVADPDLSVARIARRHNISERYAYLILSRFGITFSDWVREQRLTGAAADLSSPAFGAENISAVCRRWGFSDHANFTRAFRRHFGSSPSEYRRRALGAMTSD